MGQNAGEARCVGYVLQLHNGFYYVGTTIDLPRRLEEHRSGRAGSRWTARHGMLQCVMRRELTAAHASGWETNTTAEWMLDKGVDKVRGAGLTHDRDYTLQDEDLLVRTIGHALNLEFNELRQRIRPQLHPLPVSAQGRSNMPFVGDETVQRGEEWECPFCPRSFETFEVRAVHVAACRQTVYGSECHRCGRNDGHWQNECQHKVDVDGDPIDEVWECLACHREFDDEQHAARHVNGCAAFARGGDGGGRSLSNGHMSGDGARGAGLQWDRGDDCCFRCGRDSHWIASCYARTHINGSRLD